MFSISVSKHFTNSKELMNVFMRVGFGSTIELVAFDKGQMISFNGKFIGSLGQSYCRTRSRSNVLLIGLHWFIVGFIHWIVKFDEVYKKIDKERDRQQMELSL